MPARCTRDVAPSTDTQQTRDVLGWYLENTLKPGDGERHCGE